MNRIILLSFFLVSIFSSTTMAASCPSGTGIATPTTWAAFSTAAADPTISSICVDASIAPTLTLTSGTNTLILTRQSPAPPLTIYTVNGVVAIDGASSYRILALTGSATGMAISFTGFKFQNARAASSSHGGAVQISYASNGKGTITFTNCIFYNNKPYSSNPGGNGGAVAVLGGGSSLAIVSFNSCTFDSNSVTFGSSHGGAIYTNGLATVTITGCTFTGNSAPAGGAISVGGSGNSASLVTISSSTFSTSAATTGEGGAIRYYHDSNAATTSLALQVSGTTFSGSSASSGSGSVFAGTVTSLSTTPVPFVFSTITITTANAGTGGGVFHLVGEATGLAPKLALYKVTVSGATPATTIKTSSAATAAVNIWLYNNCGFTVSSSGAGTTTITNNISPSNACSNCALVPGTCAALGCPTLPAAPSACTCDSGLPYGSLCVSSCGVNTYANDAGACVAATSCQAGTFGGVISGSNFCVLPENCPAGQYGNPNNRLCSTSCPVTGAIFASDDDKLCYTAAQCYDTHGKFGDVSSGKCVTPAGCVTNSFASVDTKTCLTTCIDPHPYGDSLSRTCVDECVDSDAPYGSPDTHKCVNAIGCGAKAADPTTGVCVATCPTSYYKDPEPNLCVAEGSCSIGYPFADPTTSTCVSVCSGVLPYGDVTNGVCTDAAGCSATPLPFGDDTTGECTDFCSPGTYGDRTTSICTSVCPAAETGDDSSGLCCAECVFNQILVGGSCTLASAGTCEGTVQACLADGSSGVCTCTTDTVDCSGKGLTSMPALDYAPLSITNLILTGVPFTTSSIRPDIFTPFTNLLFIELSNTDMPVPPPSLFIGLTSLTTLYMNNNNLNTLPPSLFYGLDSLTDFSATGNSFAPGTPSIWDDSGNPQACHAQCTSSCSGPLASDCCDPTCASCSGPGPNECLSCFQLYSVDSSGFCVPNPVNSIPCDGNSPYPFTGVRAGSGYQGTASCWIQSCTTGYYSAGYAIDDKYCCRRIGSILSDNCVGGCSGASVDTNYLYLSSLGNVNYARCFSDCYAL